MSIITQQITGVVMTTAYFILLCTIIELASQQEKFRWSVRWPGILFGLLAPVFGIVVSLPLQMLWQSLGVPPLITLPFANWLGTAGAVGAGLLVVDFLMYWEHRFEHRFLWPIHAVHHSAEHLSAATSYSHPLQFVPMFLMISLPMSLIDFGFIATPYFVAAIIFFLQLFIHSPVKFGFGPFRHLLVDPAFHRIHHSMEERHYDRNFSILFSFWDRLFGTQVMPGKDEWPRVGIHEAASPRTVTELLALPFRLWNLLPTPTADPEPKAALREAAEAEVFLAEPHADFARIKNVNVRLRNPACHSERD